ncbi:bifunctional 2',3'-cyclic-nucleotide 2'-phosphodiesterase/3'-nucleotidase [Streptococcus cuniculipharyngis]|uniref:Bifunctional 2',3'-cyclic-nucleotide 2'-phosphodiesterase/3'-nucleotidase n=1 Tax=Streptococcus cuniculipharyngis TaxID=1562651 RepID=A0A5C5SAZ6_9STRE|nr:bifunctional 2',3'-cyclic-nucleotide 2'-phosphodiesterase/3'-nucleotidase [Streptococcus cuniculipharyngis]TWS97421.1 bifunctional 2',3'-cyclic-nucleotide 2'-phosphodiesterase/3'-nucleotidase [Streptococcus cuniculipharyngis]
MSKHYLSKSALLLSLVAAAVGTTQLVQAEEANLETSPQTTALDTSTQVQASNPSVTEQVLPTSQTDNQEATQTPTPAETSEPEAVPVALNTDQATEDLTPVEGQNVNVRILSTTDLHTNLVNYDYYQDKPSQNIGLAKTAVLIDQARQENSNTVLVDSGDTIQGTPLGTYKATVNPVKEGENHPMYAAMETLNYDAANIGNHEFNYGLDFLQTVVKGSNVPLLNANVIDAKTNQPLFKTYDIVTKTFTDVDNNKVALKVGITGIVPPQIMNWDKANLEGKVTVRDAVQAVKELIPTIRAAGADLVLVVAHSGIGDETYTVGEENVSYQLASLEGVDALVTGHSHAEFPSAFYEKYANVDVNKGTINGTPVVMAGKYGDRLGVIDLNVTYTDGKWQVNKDKSSGSLRKIDTKSEAVDEKIIELAKTTHEQTVAYVRQQVGTTTAPITSYFALVKDDPSVQIVNNAQLWYVKNELAGTAEGQLPLLSAAAPFKAGARNDPTAYTDIPAGPLAIKNVADLYVYDNVTAILKVTGADLREWLEMAAGQFNQVDPSKAEPQELVNTTFRTYNFDVIDGVTYEYDITQPNKYDHNGNLVNETANRVKNLRYQGQLIDDKQEFIVVTNNYRANGTFPGVKNASLNRLLNLENRQAIINYIISEKTINPTADNNWRFADTVKGLDLRFRTADYAKSLLADGQDISYLEPNALEGFGTFRFNYLEPQVEEDKTTEQTPEEDVDQTPSKEGQETSSTNQTDKQPTENQAKADEQPQEENKEQAQNTTKPATNKANSPKQTATVQALSLSTAAAKSTKEAAPSRLSRVEKHASLPNTGSSATAFLNIMGLGLLGLAAKLGYKKKGIE